MKKDIRSFVSGCIVTAAMIGLVGGAAATVGQKTAALDYSNIKVTLDGKQVNLVDANGQTVEPFAIDGTTYLPVRAVSNALGLEVSWDAATSTVVLTSNEQTSTTTPSDSGNVSGKVGDYTVVIKSATVTTDYEGNPAIVVNYNWTNGSTETKMALTAVLAKAFQDGVQLDSAMMLSDNYTPNTATELKPGASLDVQAAFVLRNTTSPVEFELSEAFAFDNDQVVAKTFDIK